MCQTLVERVARSEQLKAVAEPDVLVLFEDWMEELELEATRLLRDHPGSDAGRLADYLGISKAGAQFLLIKLRKTDKIS